MARAKVGEVRKKQPSRRRKNDEPQVLLGNLTYLDLFPYHPTYQFNGFRSAFGAACTIVFLFAVILNIFEEISEFQNSPPDIKDSFHKTSGYRDSRTVPVPSVGIVFKKDGYEPFYNDKFFKFTIEQGVSRRGAKPSYQDAGLKTCTLDDPDGFIKYENIKCPVSDLSFQGNENLEYFRFVEITMEQCVNWTTWDSVNGIYVPWRGSTTSDQSLCANQTSIDQILSSGVLSMFFLESDIRTDTETKEFFSWWRRMDHSLLSTIFQSNIITVRLKKLRTDNRYVLDQAQTNTNMLSIAYESTKLADLAPTLEVCSDTDNCDTYPHLYRMKYVFKLDSIYQLQIRASTPLYSLFMNFGGVSFFFLVVFGGTAITVNRYIFQQQTKGLDLRKLDNSQFDKFGNLIDKSFQMPRELQDMTAE